MKCSSEEGGRPMIWFDTRGKLVDLLDFQLDSQKFFESRGSVPWFRSVIQVILAAYLQPIEASKGD